MAQTASPVWVVVVAVLVGPLVMAYVCRFMMRGWAMTVQGGRVSERTAKRQRLEFRLMLVLFYAVAVVEFIIALAKGTI